MTTSWYEPLGHVICEETVESRMLAPGSAAEPAEGIPKQNAEVFRPISNPRAASDEWCEENRCPMSDVDKGPPPSSIKLKPRRRLPALCTPSPSGIETATTPDGHSPKLAIDSFFSTNDEAVRCAQERPSVALYQEKASVEPWAKQSSVLDTTIETGPGRVSLSPIEMDVEVTAMKGLAIDSPISLEAGKSAPSFVQQRERKGSFSEYISSPARSMQSSFSDYVPSPACAPRNFSDKNGFPSSVAIAIAKKGWSPSPRKVRLKVLSHTTPGKGTPTKLTPRHQRPPLSARSYCHLIENDREDDQTMLTPRKSSTDSTKPSALRTPLSTPRRKRGVTTLSQGTPLPKFSLTPRKTARKLDVLDNDDLGPMPTSIAGVSHLAPKGSRVCPPTPPQSIDALHTNRSISFASGFSPCDISHMSESDDEFFLLAPSALPKGGADLSPFTPSHKMKQARRSTYL